MRKGRSISMGNIIQVIRNRKSVRTFNGEPLTEEHRKDIEEFIKDIPNPLGIPVKIRLLDAKQNGLSSPVLAGETLYAAGIVEKKPYAEVALGYSFEKFVLHAYSLGLGGVWIGGTMKRELFEKAAELKDGEMMPCVTPLGYPAGKRSVKETLMRKGIGADSRINSDKLFYSGGWGEVLTPGDDIAEVLDLVRWAPSAANKQPWRIVYKDGRYHFYEKKNNGYASDSTGDMQKVDIGIALYHFVAGLDEKSRQTEVIVEDPGIKIPADAEYIVSVEIK